MLNFKLNYQECKKNVSESAGFSLVEILVVTVIAGMIVLVIANIFPAISLIGSGNNEMVAREVAAQKMEDFRVVGYDNLVSNSPNGVSITDTRLDKLKNASASAIISDCTPSICPNNENIKQIKISVQWTESGKTKKFEVSTLVGEGGLR